MEAAEVSVAEVVPAKDMSQMPLPVSDASEYAGRWLLILGRHNSASVVLENRKELESSKADLKPAVVYTSRLDGMEPCSHVVVGRHFAMKEEALYWSRLSSAPASHPRLCTRALSHPLTQGLRRVVARGFGKRPRTAHRI